MPKQLSERDEALAERVSELVIEKLAPMLASAGVAVVPPITDIIARELGVAPRA